MTDKLPPNLLKLFAPRPAVPFLEPLDREEEFRTGPNVEGLAKYLYALNEPTVPYQATESLEEKRERKKREKGEREKQTIKQKLEQWNPNSDPEVKGDPFKTLIIARLHYDVAEADLKQEFERFGVIKNIRLVSNKNGVKMEDKNTHHRGYAFIEYEREKDLKVAYHEADAMKIKGKRVVVDVERGRSVKGWLPRRLGGGLGYTRKGADHENQHQSGREGGPRHRESEAYGYRDSRPRERRRSRSPRGGRDSDRYRERERERHVYRDRDSERTRERDRYMERGRDHDRRDSYRR